MTISVVLINASVTAAIVSSGILLFGKFERAGGMPRRLIRVGVLIGATAFLSYFFGYWALILPFGATIAGSIFHFWWCYKNDINPWTAEPYDRYLELRGWK